MKLGTNDTPVETEELSEDIDNIPVGFDTEQQKFVNAKGVEIKPEPEELSEEIKK